MSMVDFHTGIAKVCLALLTLGAWDCFDRNLKTGEGTGATVTVCYCTRRYSGYGTFRFARSNLERPLGDSHQRLTTPGGTLTI